MPETACRYLPMRRLRAALLAIAGVALAAWSSPAAADLKLCNTTPGRVGVAIGYQDTGGWISEGWWTIPGESCETLIKGRLANRYYYVHAVDYDRGGEWVGPHAMCLDDKLFAIRGREDCETRGHRAGGFMEVDTNDSRAWTIRLADPGETQKAR